MPALADPVIFLPGIMGSTLRDEYPVSPDNVWSVARAAFKSYERITLHPDNLHYELQEPARVVKDQVFSLFYGEIIEELRYNLTPRPDYPVPVYPFAYDWRQPLVQTQKELTVFIEEVIERTSLQRHYHEQGYKSDTGRVNLVAHSMGGLICAGHIADQGMGRVNKVVTIASPFRGSLEAIAKTILGSSGFSSSQGGSREREAARVTPALYHLLPSFTGAVKPQNANLYDPANWQRGILATLALFIERHSLKVEADQHQQREAQAAALAHDLLGDMLTEAKAHRDKLESLVLDDSKRWLAIVGVGGKTRLDFKLRHDPQRGPLFELPEEKSSWKPRRPTTSTGDNTVPYLGARCSFIPTEQVVCLAPEDYGFWEIGDKLLRQLGFHGALPSMNVAIRLAVSHLRGTPQGDIWGRVAPDIEPEDWDPPIIGLRRK